MIGHTLSDRYEILRELGRGGMGVVYAARDLVLERDVALKLLPSTVLSGEAETRFRREARLVAKMDHPGVVGLYDIGEHEGALFLLMPLVDGATLRSLIDRVRLSIGDAVEIGRQVADALDYSHALGVVHRDIKPENIMVSRTEAGEPRIRVLDFGIAMAATETRVTQTGQMVGTLAYLSPEQIMGQDADERADIYALGAVLHECLSGRMLYSGTVPAILHRIAHEAPPRISTLRDDIPPGLDSIIRACLAKEPADRPARAREVADALARLRAEPAVNTQVGAGSTDAVIAPRRTFQRSTIVGRDEQLKQLQRHMRAAFGGECHLALVAGEAGIGKSLLLEAFELVVRGVGGQVLHGRFLDRDQSFPYQGFCDVLHEHLRVQMARTTASPGGAADFSSDLVTLFPSLAEIGSFRASGAEQTTEVRADSPRFADRTAVFEILARSIATIAGGAPLVLLLEDLHAADASVDALAYIVRRLGPAPVFFVGTYRSTEVNRAHPLPRLIAAYRRDPRFALLKLKPLTEDEQRTLVESLLGAEVDPEFAEALYRATEGNPYYTRELVRSLDDTGVLATDANGRRGLAGGERLSSEAFPETIHQAVEERVERLPEAPRDLLAIASVLGRSFDLADLELLAEGDDREAEVEGLVEAGFLSEEHDARGDRFSFTSGVLRDVLYAGLPRRKRRSLHRTFAERLEVRHHKNVERVLPLLVHHYAQGRVSEKAVAYAVRAARAALDACSPEDAARAARTALEFLGESDEGHQREGEVRMLLASAHRMAGETAAALKDAAAAVRVFEASNRVLEAVRAIAFAAEAAWEGREVEGTGRWVERGLDAARRLAGDPDVGDVGAVDALLGRLLGLGAVVANLRGEHDVAAGYLGEAEALRPAAAPEEPDVRGSGRGSGRGPGRGTIRVPFLPELHSLDPARVTGNVALEALSAVFETLTHLGEGARIVPWLAEEVRAEAGGTRFRFRLREGVRFHNGQPLTARDVRWSFERLLKTGESENRWVLAPVRGSRALADGEVDTLAGFTIDSETEFTIELEHPVSFFPTLLASRPTAILPEAVADFGAIDAADCAGTGPFRVVRFMPGRRLELAANPAYWRAGYPRSDAIVFTFGVPPAEIRDGFVEGRYSLARGLPAADVEALRRDPEFASGYRETPQLTTTFVAFNVRSGPLADERLRGRLAAAVDIRDIVRRTLGRTALAAHSLVPPGMLGFEPESWITSSVPRPETGQLGGEVELTCIALRGFLEGHYAALAREVLDAFARCGVRIRMLSLSQPELERARALAETDLCLWGWVADYPDADTFFHGILHREAGVVGKYCGSPEVDRLVERGRTEADPGARHRIYRDIEEEVQRRALLLPLSHPLVSCFARPEVSGLDLNFSTPLVCYERIQIRRDRGV